MEVSLDSVERSARNAFQLLDYKRFEQVLKPHHPTRAAVLLLLIGRCREHVLDGNAGGETNIRTYEERFRRLLEDSDAAVAYYASLFILRRLIRHRPTEYRFMLKRVVNSSRVSSLSLSLSLLKVTIFCLVVNPPFS